MDLCGTAGANGARERESIEGKERTAKRPFDLDGRAKEEGHSFLYDA